MSVQTVLASDIPKAPALLVALTTRNYRIARGDTLARIARRNGVSQKALAQANPGVQTAKLRVGQLLRIPEGSQVAIAAMRLTNATKGDAQPPGGAPLYTVKSGDTLSKIAQTHGTTISALRALNQLNSDQLLVGKTLKLPTPAASATSSNLPAQP